MRSLRKVILPIVLALAVIGVPACDLLQESEGPTLEVMSPQDFAKVQLGESVDVVSTATDPQGVTRVELYVGENLYRTDGSPSPEGETSWTFTQTWTPTAPGSYTLTVVAYNVDGLASTPWAVAIEVVEGPTTGDTPVSTIPPATGTPPPGATGTPQPPPPSTGTVAPPPPTGTAPPQPTPTGTAPPPPPTDTPVPPPPTNTPPPMADLYIAELSIDPQEPHAGKQVQLRVVFGNGGNAPSASFGGGASSTVPWTLMTAWQCGPLAPGEEHVFTPSFTFTEPGLATITAGIGLGPMNQDGNEDNNTAELVVTVQPSDLPDLYISRVSLDPSSPQVGQVVEVEVEIDNAGPGDAGRHTVTWKSDPDTTSCSWPMEGVPAGMSIIRRCTYTYTYPHSGQSTYTTADANGDVDESNEDNNVRYLRVNVRPAS